jgi:hypothetical protein
MAKNGNGVEYLDAVIADLSQIWRNGPAIGVEI